MSETLIGLLHPGEMGAAVAACLTGRGYQVLWVPAGRGPATRARAAAAGLTAAAGPDAAGQSADLARRADIILSVCPPHAALEVARAVAAAGFTGTYVDANAISPGTAHQVRSIVETAGAPLRGRRDHRPPAVPGARSGGQPGRHPPLPGGGSAAGNGDGPAAQVAALFEGTALTPVILRNENPAGASALKMAYAAWTKGSAALLLAARALARAEGVAGQPAGRVVAVPAGPGRPVAGGGPVRGGQGLALGRRDGGDRRQHDLRRPARRVPSGRRGGLPPLIVGRR